MSLIERMLVEIDKTFRLRVLKLRVPSKGVLRKAVTEACARALRSSLTP